METNNSIDWNNGVIREKGLRAREREFWKVENEVHRKERMKNSVSNSVGEAVLKL